MKLPASLTPGLLLLFACALRTSAQTEAGPAPPTPETDVRVQVPAPLQPWMDWVLRDLPHHRTAPRPFDNAQAPLPVWPAQIAIDARDNGVAFEAVVTVYSPEWTALPGDSRFWPQDVLVNGVPGTVIPRDDVPHIHLAAGRHKISGQLVWSQRPPNIRVPQAFGLLTLVVDAQPVPLPRWDQSGLLWFQTPDSVENASQSEEAVSVRIFRLLEDGIPMWLRTRVEITAAGKNREEHIGHILPEGWTVATVNSPIPCALDATGLLKVQLRPGVWTVVVDAFRATPLEAVSYPSGISPAVQSEIVGFHAAPNFRLLELQGLQAIDVSQTSYPAEWRNFPVYLWNTQSAFQLEERLRGMGSQQPPGLRVNRQLWLWPDGTRLTFRDDVRGEALQSWRLDLSSGQSLGAARIDGQPQLITRNPATGSPGIELRTRNITMEATGFIESPKQFPSAGWQTTVESASVNLELPPGWRLFAVQGAGWSNGDWLSAWSLLDVFVVLVLTIAIFKLFNPLAAGLALLTMLAIFHEPGAPRWLWLLLLVPIAMLRALPAGRFHKLVRMVYLVLAALLVMTLVPFVASQLQAALYPQLEPLRQIPTLFQSAENTRSSEISGIEDFAAAPEPAAAPEEQSLRELGKSYVSQKQAGALKRGFNLMYAPDAKIQTGPALPQWQWRTASYGWRGPVAPEETVTLHLIPPPFQRALSVARACLAALLAALLTGFTRLLPSFLFRTSARTIASFPALLAASTLAVFPPDASAQSFPDSATLEQLREHLLKTPTAFPNAASMPSALLAISDDHTQVHIETTIHTAEFVAVPLPGPLPTWSPVAVTVNGTPADTLLRREGYLWIALPPGQHSVILDGLLPDVPQWECSFLLRPQRLEVDAPGWTTDGLDANGVPGQTVFLVRETPVDATEGGGSEAAYDQRDFHPILRVERQMELGIVWKIRTTVSRLADSQKAVAINVPLLAGERILSADFGEISGVANVRLEPGQQSTSWESELPATQTLTLTAAQDAPWVEVWKLNASPIWNVTLMGLTPVHEAGEQSLEPIWQPWPGESATLTVARPEAVTGPTLTVTTIAQRTSAGVRQTETRLEMRLEASIGQELRITIDPALEVSSLQIAGPNGASTAYPVRREANALVIPIVPGEQTVTINGRKPSEAGWQISPPAFSLPIPSSNITTELRLPDDRWLLWTTGPQRGPAVRLWTVLLCVFGAAIVLSRLKTSPLHGAEWILLGIGLVQVHTIAALYVAAWFFLVAWRGSPAFPRLHPVIFNLFQLTLLMLALPVVVILFSALNRGFLGIPEMLVAGNGSTSSVLRWFAPQADSALPQPAAFTVSIWFYRALMLFWALWLAFAGIRWVRWAWDRWTQGEAFRPILRRNRPSTSVIPPQSDASP